MRAITLICFLSMCCCELASGQVQHLREIELVKPPYRHVFRRVDILDQFNLTRGNWSALCKPAVAECAEELWRLAPPGNSSIAVADVRACALTKEPICQLSSICPDGGFLDVGPQLTGMVTPFMEMLFYCEGDAITIRNTTDFPVGPAFILGQPATSLIVIDGQETLVYLYTPTCGEGDMPMISGCRIPTTSDGTQFENICVDPQQYPEFPEQSCSGDWYIETDDGRCWNLPCSYSLGWRISVAYDCKVAFGEPREVPCNDQCMWTGRECGCEGCRPACEDLKPNCLSDVPRPELPD